ISSDFLYRWGWWTGFAYGAADRFDRCSGGFERHPCGLRTLRGLALGDGLPRRPAGQIADRWTFPLCSDIGATPGKDSSAPERRPFCRYPIQFRPTTSQKDIRVQVLVRDNNVDQALKALKKKMQREGIFREMKLRGHYEKP